MQKNTQIAEEKELVTGDSKRLSKTKFEEYMDMETHKDGIPADTEGREASRNISSSHRRTVYDQINTPLEPMRKKKTKFEKYLELENQNGATSAKEDLALERKLTKQLKVKERKLGGDGDEINMLLEGIPSVFDFLETEEITDVEEGSRRNISWKKHNKNSKKKLDLDAEIKSHDLVEELETEHESNHAQASVMEKPAKYGPRQLKSMSRSGSEEYSRIRKRVRGLLNRLGESNLERITGEMFSIFQLHSISRSDGAQIISEEILTSCSGGPRGNEEYAAVFAALVSGLACLVGIDFGAKLLASLAKCCGMRLRSDDPATMKNFIVSIQNKVTELKAASGDSQGNTRIEGRKYFSPGIEMEQAS
ncbi:hypothetical protein L1987_09359 [Smallanthus sonchifolius]|uniref:Uncharacterized protein n=1 Tax=Smallanthus sonchifolius TaxID=185202 RepID=A0ACB9JPU1_9ASTR|nr:hypothetical protein L1987_09359 [Smallanthus sonchifolius]